MPLAYWSLAWAVLLLVLSSLAVGGLTALAGADLRLEDTRAGEADVVALRIAMAVVIGRQVLLVAGIWALYRNLAVPPGQFPLANIRWWPIPGSVLLWSVGTYGAVIAYVALVTLLGVEWLKPTGTLGEEVTRDPLTLLLASLLAIVVAPISEELLFRGVLFGALSRFGIVLAALASGLIFALPHFDVGSILPFTLVGAALAFVYFRHRSLASAIYVHVLFNAVSLVLLIGSA
jgi:membrane protease YdiL (CAAX protease family)